MLLGSMRRENLRALQILRQRRAEMGVLEGPQVLWASRIRGADLRGLNGKVCFAQATATQELIV